MLTRKKGKNAKIVKLTLATLAFFSASRVALAPGALGALTQPRSPNYFFTSNSASITSSFPLAPAC